MLHLLADTSSWQDSLAIILLGILEGITEFLPVSSTGHLLIAEHFLGAQTDAFNVIIQSGAVLAVVLIYWQRLVNVFTHLGERENQLYLGKLAFAFAVTAGGYKALDHVWQAVFGKPISLPEELLPVVGALLVGALIIFWVEARVKKNPSTTFDITWTVAFWIGVAQILAAVFPGLSRSGATIIAAMMCGAMRTSATEFSFLLSIPTMFAASAVKGREAYHAGLFVPDEIAKFVIGFIISLITAFIVVKWLLQFVRSHNFTTFAWYRIGLGLVLLIVMRKDIVVHTPSDVDMEGGRAPKAGVEQVELPEAPEAEVPADATVPMPEEK